MTESERKQMKTTCTSHGIRPLLVTVSAFLLCQHIAGAAAGATLAAVPGIEAPNAQDGGKQAQAKTKVIYDNDFESLPLGPFDARWKDGKQPFIIDNTYTGNPVTYAVVDSQDIGGRAIEFDINGFVQCDFGITAKVEKGKTYRISGTVASQGNKKYSILLRRGPPPYTGYVVARGHANEMWKPFSYIVESSGDDDAHLMMSADGESKLWLGSLKVEETDEKPEIKTPPILGNLIVNSSFELQQEGWHWRDNRFGQTHAVAGKGACSEEVSHSGLGSFLLQGKACVSAPFQPIASGHEYVLSAMVMANQPVSVGMGICGPDNVGGGHHIKTPMQWEKIVFRHTFEQPKGFAALENAASASIHVDLPENGKVWVDDVDLRVAPEAPFAPRFQKEFSVRTSAPRNVVIAGTPVTWELACAVWRGTKDHPVEVPKTIEADLFQFDEDGALFRKWTGIRLDRVKDEGTPSKAPRADGFAVYRGRLDVKSLEHGYWRFAAAESAEPGLGSLSGVPGSARAPDITVDMGEALVTVIPRLPEETPFSWQTGAHGRMDELWKCGVRWMRLHDASIVTKWHFLESEKGTWKWAVADAEIDGYRKAGFRILGLLDGCPGWRRPDGKANGFALAYPDTDFGDWENYVFQTVSHFKGRIDAWELMNEAVFFGKGPGERSNPEWYVELQKVAYKAAKKADPNCFVVGAGGAGSPNVNDEWFAEAIQAGLLEYCDAVSFHGYGVANARAAAVGVDPIGAFVRWIQSEAEKRTGKRMAIWDTEVGVTPPTSSKRYIWPQRDFGTIPSNVRNSLVTVLGEKSAGVEKTFIYHSWEIGLFEANCDLVNFADINGQMTPVAQTIAVAEWLTHDLVPEAHFQPAPKVNVLGFQSVAPAKMRKVWFIWATGSEPTTVTVKVPAGSKVRALSVFGRDLDFNQDGDNIRVKVIPWPAYVVAE